MKRWLALLFTMFTSPVVACDLALVLAVDVSGSVDRKEFTIQMQGLSAALRDGVVTDALVSHKARVTVVQWTGSTRQRQTLPWKAMTDAAAVADFANAVDQNPRHWQNFSTAIGEALEYSAALFDEVPQCTRRVIDVSGDGVSNEGIAPRDQLAALRRAGITVTAIAIETDETDLTAYFYENLIVGEGAFVVTASGFADYPAQIRRKLQRETTKQVSFVTRP